VNATTMGTVTLILHYFSDAQINPHNSMIRLRMADSLTVKLPDAVEKYFNKPYQLPDFYSDKFLHSQMVLPDFTITPRRLYVETILAACPTKYTEDEQVENLHLKSSLWIHSLFYLSFSKGARSWNLPFSHTNFCNEKDFVKDVDSKNNHHRR